MNKNNNHFDVIVIGAGPGGTTVASLLANANKKVLLVDKNNKPGGKMMTIKKWGHTYEMFPINCVPGKNSLFEKLSTELGKSHLVNKLNSKTKPNIMFKDQSGNIRSIDFTNPLKILTGLGTKNPFQIINAIRLLQKLANMKEDEINGLYDISAIDYMSQFDVPEVIRTFIIGSFGEGTFEMTSDKVPAANMIKILQIGMNGGSTRYYQGGIGHFFEVMAQTVEEKSGKCLMNTRVASIAVENGSVCGITTTDGDSYTAPIVISSAGIRQTVLKLVGENYFPQDYVERIKNLESNLACIGFRYFVNQPVLKNETNVFFPLNCLEPWSEFENMAQGITKPSHNYIYLGTKSIHPGISPEGKQIIYACMSCHPDPKQDVEPYLDYIENELKGIVPELFSDGIIERKEIMGLQMVSQLGTDSIFPGQGGESYGIANSIGQTGPTQPKCETPINGLYIVGNDAGGFGVGTHQAVDSGFTVFNLLRNED